MIELGRVDICCKVPMMSSCLALPRTGHLEQLYHIFSFLKKHHNTEMVFDPTESTIDEEMVENLDLSNLFMLLMIWIGKKHRPIICLRHDEWSIGFTMKAYVDAHHTGDSSTPRLRTGFHNYLNFSHICWYSKKKASVETLLKLVHGYEILNGIYLRALI